MEAGKKSQRVYNTVVAGWLLASLPASLLLRLHMLFGHKRGVQSL